MDAGSEKRAIQGEGATMTYSITEHDEKIVVTLEGAIELQSIRDLKESLDDLAARTRKDIEIDLSRVTYIDSTGISMMIMLHKVQKQKNLTFRMKNATTNVAGLLELSSLKDVLH